MTPHEKKQMSLIVLICCLITALAAVGLTRYTLPPATPPTPPPAAATTAEDLLTSYIARVATEDPSRMLIMRDAESGIDLAYIVGVDRRYACKKEGLFIPRGVTRIPVEASVAEQLRQIPQVGVVGYPELMPNRCPGPRG